MGPSRIGAVSVWKGTSDRGALINSRYQLTQESWCEMEEMEESTGSNRWHNKKHRVFTVNSMCYRCLLLFIFFYVTIWFYWKESFPRLNRQPSHFRMYGVRRHFRGRNPWEICDGHVGKQSPLRQADETTTDKATLLKSNYSCCEHPCDVVTDSIALITTIDSGNSDRDTALVACCPAKRGVFLI